MDSLEELVEQSDRLLMEIRGDTDLPLITRSLEQMGAYGEKMCSSRGVRSDVKAARLLGPTINYDLPKNLSAKLESLSQIKEVDFAKPKIDMDIHTFLRCERENILFTATEQAKRAVFDEVDSICRRSTSSWWDRQAAAILTALASSTGPIDTAIFQTVPTSVAADTAMGREFLSRTAPIDFSADSQASISKEELFYANQVDKYLVDSLATTQTVCLRQVSVSSGLLNKPSLFDYLYNTKNAKSVLFDESKQNDFCEVFRLIKRMFSISAINIDDVGPSETPLLDLPLPATHERALEFRSGSSLQSAFLRRAIAHLEVEFATYLQTVVSSNPRLALLGGCPGVRALVRAFLNVKNPSSQPSGDCDFDSFGDFEDGVVDSKPVWPMIYYCLRCGALQDAASVASDAANNLGDFVQILNTFMAEGRCLPPKLVANVRKTYRRIVKTSRDPYKRLVYCLLGCCDLSDAHTDVGQSIDDFLWLRLSQISTNEGTTDQQDDIENLTVGQLQSLLYETYGETYFDAWNQPLMYFKILCLSQQFEGALAFLSRIEGLRCHAVHLALLLREMKILLLPTSKQAPLVSRVDSDPSGFRRLNFVRLLLLYTRKFELSNPTLCINYYYFLHDLPSVTEGKEKTTVASPPGSGMHSLFVQCVAELAIQTGEFDLLLGRLTPENRALRQAGAIDRFASVAPPISLITIVAEMLEARGQMVQAVSVYLLAGEVKNILSAVRLINLLLVGVVATDDSNGLNVTGNSERENILRLATEVGLSVRRLDPITSAVGGAVSSDSGSCGDVSPALQSAARTLYYLLDLATFFDLASSGQWQAALDHMDRLGLLPTTAASEEIDAKVAGFAAISDFVRRPIPAAILLLLRCLTVKASTAKANEERGISVGRTPIGISGHSVCLEEVRARTRALITFIGRIPYRMPSEVYARLSQVEMQLSSASSCT
ncbi:Nuclear pore complex protein Nup93 [Echinococcus granulosus]|uniref:Nuclear pore protein n=1 Tax=Echinococcus granulosus TaxID=6210 RepID=W6UPK3_ECHGR|nr:Nuclear pore complex protein Nup93 [Echinococcus granulosus]EUB62716.1 Nuclear pore complex protein Nup93 [Echinococcus granulosus]KAH9281124.1 Nuclear pore complex protein Nup93 [Echinococcus granulosus]